MKITFVYTDCGQHNQNNFNRGVAVLSACLKRAGYQTSLIHISKPIGKKEFVGSIKKHKPDLAAFSFISNMFPQVKVFSDWVYEMGTPAIHGGMHPTVAPEECLAEKSINVIIRGEGEGAIVDFCRATESGKSAKDIPNIWLKEDRNIYRNPPRALIESLDSLPYPDYELFDYANLEEAFVYKILVTQASRGCNYGCTYCCNPLLRSLYKDNGHYLRYYTVDRLLSEVAAGLTKYPFLKEVRFYDDTITQNKEWFREFALKYKERINLPYSGNERIENIDEETVSALKDSGCVSLDLGIESGSKFIRDKYMNRHMTNDKIIYAFRLLKSAGINANSFNILGMVGETPETALETIKLNALVKPAVAFNAYFYPFKGTKAYDMVKERKYAVEEYVTSFFERPVVTLDTIKKSQLVFYYRYFYFLMRTYNFFKNTQTVDKIITSKYFPYAIFNFLHFGKDDMLIRIRKHPGIYRFLRKIYRSIKRKS